MPIRRNNFFRSSFYKKMVGYIASYKNELFSEYFGFKKIRILTVTKSDDRIRSMILVNKDLHDTGNGYNLFLFARDEAIDIRKPVRIFQQIWTNGQGRMNSLLGQARFVYYRIGQCREMTYGLSNCKSVNYLKTELTPSDCTKNNGVLRQVLSLPEEEENGPYYEAQAVHSRFKRAIFFCQNLRGGFQALMRYKWVFD